MAKSFLECLAEQEHDKVRAKSFLECLAKYNHNHDARGRFASSNAGLHSGAAGDIIKLPDEVIPRSLGAKYRNYDIVDAVGRVYHYVEGTKLRDRKVFAGYGTKFPLHEGVAEGLTREFGGDERKWQHAKGIGTIDADGEETEVEVHWFQEESVGQVKHKVKEWFE